MIHRQSCLIRLFASLAMTVLLAKGVDFDGRPAIVLRNDKIELTILIRGATLANLVLRDDAEKLSPYWNTDRAQRAAGSPPARPAGSSAIFCAWTDSERLPRKKRAAGMPFHGEASGRQFEAVSIGRRPGAFPTVKLKARLPLAQEDITRTVTLHRRRERGLRQHAK